MRGFIYVNALLSCAFFNAEKREHPFACIESISHQSYPNPEPKESLGICSSWSEKSCCDSKTAMNISNLKEEYYLNIPFNQCPHIQMLSQDCRNFFIQDLCIYHCGSMFQNYIVSIQRGKVRAERYLGIPLCKKDCDYWFEACKNDYSCSPTWLPNTFERVGGRSVCKNPCKTFSEYHTTAKNFCNTIFEGTFEYFENPNECCIDLNPRDGISSNVECAKSKYRRSKKNHGLVAGIVIVVCLFVVAVYGFIKWRNKRKTQFGTLAISA